MGVGRDHEFHTGFFRGGGVLVVEVESPRVSIDFEERASAGCGREQRFDVDVVGRATVDEASRRMTDHAYEGIFDRLDDPGRDSVTGLVLAVVQACDHPVGPGEHVVRKIKATLLEHVDLDPLEYDDGGRPVRGE